MWSTFAFPLFHGLGPQVIQTKVLAQTIENIEKVNPALNAVIHPMYDEAKRVAQRWQKAVADGDAKAGAALAKAANCAACHKKHK